MGFGGNAKWAAPLESRRGGGSLEVCIGGIQAMTTPMTAGSSEWQIPSCRIWEFGGRRSNYCVAIPIINEGARILRQLEEIHDLGIPDIADILLLDGGSTDGS